jgi:dihydroneopterin aldolase/2-amino-4-hydroxy-6-hydroxymethyldihydropteridine diphosphokinase/dihydropteroate synthase
MEHPISKETEHQIQNLRDKVYIKNLHVSANIGQDFWCKPSLQPLSVSVNLKTSFEQASLTDDLKYSLNYATITRNLASFIKSKEHYHFQSLEKFGESLFKVLLNDENKSRGRLATVSVKSSKSVIRCDYVEVEMTRFRDAADVIHKFDTTADKIKIHGLRLLTIIGVFAFERFQRQIVDLNLEIHYDFEKSTKLDYHHIINIIIDYVERSNFKTVEALVSNVSNILLSENQYISHCVVDVLKPNAMLFTDGVGVGIEKSRSDVKDLFVVNFNARKSDSSSCTRQGEFSLPNFNI